MDTYIDSKPSDDQEFYCEVSELSRLDQLFAAVVVLNDVKCQLLKGLHLKHGGHL